MRTNDDIKAVRADDAGLGGRVLLLREPALFDRLLSFCYQDKQPSPLLKDALFDLARAGSYAAMRELAARYPLDEDERAFILRVLGENDELL